MVTHLTTNPPVDSLSKPERTGRPVLNHLWPYVEEQLKTTILESKVAGPVVVLKCPKMQRRVTMREGIG